MSKVLVTESHLEDIADAIRGKLGVQTTYKPGDMAAAILTIPTGGGSTLVSKTITQNGEYDPEDDNADGYSDVTVNVPNSYTAEDEGKVVSSGALVAQTSRSVTENGTYDTTENDEVVVNVSGGGGGGSTVLQCGPYNSNNPIKPGVAGRLKLIVIAINSEASNQNLDIGVTVNQTAITGETLDYNSYSSSGNNRRNYRINEYDVNVSYTDTITLSLTNGGTHTSLFYVLGTIDINGFFQGMSTPDNITTGSYSSKAFAIYGISNDASGGGISANTVNANETITTPDPVHSYGSSFIFWIDGDLSSGGQGGDSSHTYSETEQVVGTWINGKPIYELTVITNSRTYNVESLAIDLLIFADGYGSDSSGYSGNKWTYTAVTNNSYRIIYLGNNNKTLYLDGNYQQYGFTIQYTKTTDQAVS